MKKEKNSVGPDMWNWKKSVPFSNTMVVGDQVFISGQQTLDQNGAILNPGDIAGQTRNVFENMQKSLRLLGMELSDLARLNTYYVFDGADDEATAYWEDMTRVRLEYFPDPGPAATAVRVKGMPYKGQLIQIEGVALRGDMRSNRQRIMPSESWDWSIAVPLSQGWKCGNRIFVGGQISADKSGDPVHVGNLELQTRNTFNFIEQVLLDANSSFEDMVRLKVCFKYNSVDPSTQKTFVDTIMDVSKDYIKGSPPVLSAFAVDLLYPGLDLELDAMAIVDPEAKVLNPAGLGGRYQPSEFSDGICSDGEIYVGGQAAIDDSGEVLFPGDIDSQAKEVFRRLGVVLKEADADFADIIKLNLFMATNESDTEAAFHRLCDIWSEKYPTAHPTFTPVRVHELARPGVLVQADCIAVK